MCTVICSRCLEKQQGVFFVTNVTYLTLQPHARIDVVRHSTNRPMSTLQKKAYFKGVKTEFISNLQNSTS